MWCHPLYDAAAGGGWKLMENIRFQKNLPSLTAYGLERRDFYPQKVVQLCLQCCRVLMKLLLEGGHFYS